MNKIISIRTKKADVLAEIAEVVTQYPDDWQDKVRNAFLAADDRDLDRAEELCHVLLGFKNVPEIRMLLGSCYFRRGEMYDARPIFSELAQEYPEEEGYRLYLGMTDHALGRFKDAVKELESLYPLRVYRPFYYTSYGDSLLQTGKLKQSREAFREETAYFEKTGEIVSAQMLDGAFQNLLYLDITLGNGKYPEDVRLYYDFLEQTEMTETMQANLAGNIVYFCDLMRNKWYRPLFLEFITHIKDKGFLTNENYSETLRSAFASWESFAYHDDRQISALMEEYLAACYARKYMEPDMKWGEEKDRIEVTALTYEWYMCQYGPEHPEEIDYIRENYPYTYEDNLESYEGVKNDPLGMARALEDEISSRMKKKISRKELQESLHYAYKRACESKKGAAYVYDGMETYRRIQPKVGRNDPCPCGSGKKYKKCCGR